MMYGKDDTLRGDNSCLKFSLAHSCKSMAVLEVASESEGICGEALEVDGDMLQIYLSQCHKEKSTLMGRRSPVKKRWKNPGKIIKEDTSQGNKASDLLTEQSRIIKKRKESPGHTRKPTEDSGRKIKENRRKI